MQSDGIYHYNYDAEGNRTARFRDNNHDGQLNAGDTDVTLYDYDYRNRLVDVLFGTAWGGNLTKIVEYGYDTADRQIERILDSDGDAVANEFRYTVYQGQNALFEVYDQDGLSDNIAADGTVLENDASVSHRYLYGPAVDQIMAVEDSLGHIRFGLADNEGTIRDVVERTGTSSWARSHRTYDSFGKVLTGQSDFANFSFGLNGMPLDVDTNLYQTDTVAYDPTTARRLSEDWSGFDCGTTNLTVWVTNDPWNQTDPTGRCGIKTTGYSYLFSTPTVPTAATFGGIPLTPINSAMAFSMSNTRASTASSAFVGPTSFVSSVLQRCGASGISGCWRAVGRVRKAWRLLGHNVCTEHHTAA